MTSSWRRFEGGGGYALATTKMDGGGSVSFKINMHPLFLPGVFFVQLYYIELPTELKTNPSPGANVSDDDLTVSSFCNQI